MSKNKLVRLTWRDRDIVKVEYCELISEEAIYYTVTGQKLDINLNDIFAKEGYVMFEDYDGVFGLKPNQIISIELLEESK